MSCDPIIQIKAAREAGAVVRCHIAGPTTNGYDLAQHQYGVAVICAILWPKEAALIRAALFHDTPERWNGDIPSPVLRNSSELRALLEERDKLLCGILDLPSEHSLPAAMYSRLKDADKLELYLFTFEEERRGNKELLGFRRKLEVWWRDNPPCSEIGRVISYARCNWDRLPETLEEMNDAR